MTENRNSSANDEVKAGDNESVTIMVKRRVKPEQIAAFQNAIDEFTKAVRCFPGFVEIGVLRPAETVGGSDGEWGTILHFDSEANLKNWEKSPERKHWLTLADSLSVAAPKVERVNGLEAWFGLPNRKTAAAPPKWKTAIVSAVAIYPITMVMPGFIAPFIGGLPAWLSNLVNVGVMMPLMTWGVMPLITWLFKWWLYPQESSEDRKR